MQIFDSHAHYNDEKFELDREETLQKVLDAGVKNLICAGYSVESSRQAIKIANEHRYIYATAGISPNDIPTFENENTDVKEFFFEEVLNEQLKEIKKLAKNEKVVAIGEIGLDYYWNKENKQNQKSAFIKQIEIANELELPIVIHTREAISDTIDILKNQIVKIPISSKDKEIDFVFMETLIKAIQKLVIADVVKFSDEKIKATKQVVG